MQLQGMSTSPGVAVARRTSMSHSGTWCLAQQYRPTGSTGVSASGIVWTRDKVRMTQVEDLVEGLDQACALQRRGTPLLYAVGAAYAHFTSISTRASVAPCSISSVAMNFRCALDAQRRSRLEAV